MQKPFALALRDVIKTELKRFNLKYNALFLNDARYAQGVRGQIDTSSVPLKPPLVEDASARPGHQLLHAQHAVVQRGFGERGVRHLAQIAQGKIGIRLAQLAELLERIG